MWMMLVEKEARIIPREAKRPPTIMTGRQPKRLTSTLHSGPGDISSDASDYCHRRHGSSLIAISAATLYTCTLTF